MQNIEIIIVAPVDEISIGRVLNNPRYLPLKIVAIKSLPLNTSNVEYFVGYNYFSFGTIVAKSVQEFNDYENVLFISDRSEMADQMAVDMIEEKILIEPYIVQEKLKII